MKAEQDIERQLADAQGAWESAPPAELWDRLEARLDAANPPSEPRKSKNWPFRIVGLLLPIAAVSLWWLWPSSLASDLKALPVVASQAEFSPFFADRRGVQSAAIAGSALDEPSVAPTLEEAALARSTEIARPLPVFGVHEEMQPQSKSYASNTGGQAGFNTAFIQREPFVVTPPLGNMYAGRADLEMLNYALPNGNMLVTNGNGNPVDTVSSVLQYSNLIQSMDNNRYLQINPSRNDLNFNFAAPAARDNQQNLQHLKWLLGSWKTQGTSGGAIEEWRQKDEFTLIGRGYFVVNGDTIVTQEMRIEQRGPNVYYIVAKDEHDKAMKFRLRSRMSNELIFQDDSRNTNQELVLRNKPATNEVEKIIQQPDGWQSRQVQTNTHLQSAPTQERHIMKRKE